MLKKKTQNKLSKVIWVVVRDPNTGRFVSTRGWDAFNRGGNSRGEELVAAIFLAVISLLIQAFEKAGLVPIPGINIALALIPAIILITLAEEIIEEKYAFLFGYLCCSFIFFLVSLVSFWELVFNFAFPLFIALLFHYFKVINTYTNETFIDGLLIFLGIIVIVSFALSGWGQSNILNTSTTTTVNTTTSTSSTSTTSTSTSTTTSSTTTIIYKGTCNAFRNFTCGDAYLSQENKLNIIIKQKTIPVMYNIQIGCGNTIQSNGFPSAQFYNETFNLTKGQPKQIDNLTCTGAQNGTFVGYLWLNYTEFSGKPAAINNSYYESEVASINIPWLSDIRLIWRKK